MRMQKGIDKLAAEHDWAVAALTGSANAQIAMAKTTAAIRLDEWAIFSGVSVEGARGAGIFA
jgi:hypothetical protein